MCQGNRRRIAAVTTEDANPGGIDVANRNKWHCRIRRESRKHCGSDIIEADEYAVDRDDESGLSLFGSDPHRHVAVIAHAEPFRLCAFRTPQCLSGRE